MAHGEMSSYRNGKRTGTPDTDATDFTANQDATDESGLKGGAASLPGETAGLTNPRVTRNIGRDGPGGNGIS